MQTFRMKHDVLYLDGDPDRQKEICRALESVGLAVKTVATLDETRFQINASLYALVLVYLAGDSRREAISFCAFAHSSDPIRILMVLMKEPCLELEARLFDSGVSDVVAGVQACPELIAKRIWARLRASRLLTSRRGKVVLGDTVVDFDRYEVRRNGTACRLSGVVLDLLWYFICNAGRVVSRRELSESSVWARSICTPPEEGGKTFDIHISRLRKVIEHDPDKPVLIQSVRGVGWKLSVEPAWRTREPQAVSS